MFQCLKDIMSDSKEEMVTIMTFSFFKWYFFIFHMSSLYFLYLNFSQNLPTLMPVQLNVPFLSKNKQNHPPQKKPSEKDNQPIRMTKKYQNKTTWKDRAMESSYATPLRLSMGPALTQQSKCTYETRDLTACTSLLQLRTDSWPEKGKWTQSSTLTKKLFTTNTCEERGSLHWRGTGYIFSVWVCHT